MTLKTPTCSLGTYEILEKIHGKGFFACGGCKKGEIK